MTEAHQVDLQAGSLEKAVLFFSRLDYMLRMRIDTRSQTFGRNRIVILCHIAASVSCKMCKRDGSVCYD
jgi:hypothetical protein